MSWDAVMIAWDNGKVATVHRGTCARSSEPQQRRLLNTPCPPGAWPVRRSGC